MFFESVTFYLSWVYLSQLALRKSTRKVNTAGLISKADIYAERRVDVSCRTVLLLNSLEVLDVLLVKRDELAVLVDARRCHGLGEDGRVAGEVVGEENGGRSDIVFLCHGDDTLVLEKRRPCATEGAVGGDVNALLLAEINNLLLGQERVILDLIGSRHNGGLCEQLFKVLDGVVGNTDGLDLLGVGLDQLLEVLPCVDMCDGVVDVTAAVLELREKGVVS